MESAIGSLNSPEDVFKQRYVDFIDNLLPESSSLTYALLASYIDRLTPEMFRAVQHKIQTKIVDASRLESSEGIVFFAWNILKNHPKVLTYNQDAFRAIAWKALDRAFEECFVKNEIVDDSVLTLPFQLFAKVYGNEWKIITSTITAVAKKNPPYKQDSIMDLSIINKYGGTKKYQLLYFLWSLLDSVILHYPKGLKLNVEYILKVAETTFYCKHEEVTVKVFDTLITISRMIKSNFAIYIDRILSIVQAFSIPSKILYKFLINLIEELGTLLENAEIFQRIMLKFVEEMKAAKNVGNKMGNNGEDYIIGRSEGPTDLFNSFEETQDSNDDVDDFESLYELAICVLETIPSSIPISYIKNIQKEFCAKIIESGIPSTKDLRMLNALLAIRNEEILSPVAIARTIYSWASLNNNFELIPYIKIGKALCDVHRSLRSTGFDLLSKEEGEEGFINNLSTNNGLIKGTKKVDEIMEEEFPIGGTTPKNAADIAKTNIGEAQSAAATLVTTEEDKITVAKATKETPTPVNAIKAAATIVAETIESQQQPPPTKEIIQKSPVANIEVSKVSVIEIITKQTPPIISEPLKEAAPITEHVKESELNASKKDLPINETTISVVSEQIISVNNNNKTPEKAASITQKISKETPTTPIIEQQQSKASKAAANVTPEIVKKVETNSKIQNKNISVARNDNGTTKKSINNGNRRNNEIETITLSSDDDDDETTVAYNNNKNKSKNNGDSSSSKSPFQINKSSPFTPVAGVARRTTTSKNNHGKRKATESLKDDEDDGGPDAKQALSNNLTVVDMLKDLFTQ